MDIVIPITISLLFFIAKFLEMKYVEREFRPLKYLIRDTLMVFGAAMVTLLVYDRFQAPIQEFVQVVTNSKPVAVVLHPEIFTDGPGF